MRGRNQFAALLGALALYVALPAPAGGITTPQYWVHMAPQKQAAILVWQATGQWTSEWISVGDGGAQWIDPNTGKMNSVEHWTQRGGFLMIDYFANGFDFEAKTTPGYQRIPANCVKAVLQDVPSGQMIDLPCDGHGHYYVPWLLPRDPWRIFVWGNVGYPFFWAAEFTPALSVTNPCYYAGPQVRDAVVQREVWWDRLNGWAEGSGGPAFDATGKPIMPLITYGIEATVGLGEGVMLRRDVATGQSMCLYSRWTWG
jgi:hypothetical protein